MDRVSIKTVRSFFFPCFQFNALPFSLYLNSHLLFLLYLTFEEETSNMELGLSLGENSRQTTFSSFVNKSHKMNTTNNRGLGFCMSLSLTGFASPTQEAQEREVSNDGEDDREERRVSSDSSLQQPLQLDLLPLAPVPRNTWLSENGINKLIFLFFLLFCSLFGQKVNVILRFYICRIIRERI